MQECDAVGVTDRRIPIKAALDPPVWSLVATHSNCHASTHAMHLECDAGTISTSHRGKSGPSKEIECCEMRRGLQGLVKISLSLVCSRIASVITGSNAVTWDTITRIPSSRDVRYHHAVHRHVTTERKEFPCDGDGFCNATAPRRPDGDERDATTIHGVLS